MISLIIAWIKSLFSKKETDMKTKITKHNSIKDNFYKQTNNERDPYVTCFPTSMINASQAVGIKLPTDKNKTGKYSQPEDQFDWFLHENPECVEFWKKPKFSDYLSNKNNDPRELYDVEQFAFEKWIGKKVSELKYNASAQTIVDTITKGGAVVTSGLFCGFGHVICIVGYNAECENPENVKIDEVSEFIIYDSYGNPHNNYKPVGVGGLDVIWEKEEFLKKINKGTGSSQAFNIIAFNK